MSKTQPKVLLVEDSKVVAEYLIAALDVEEGSNIEVVHAERLADAATILNQREFDVLLVDLSLPDSHGMGTITRAKALSPNTPVLVLSSSDDGIVRAESLRHGACAYLVKGIASAGEIMQAIRLAIESQPRQEDGDA